MPQKSRKSSQGSHCRPPSGQGLRYFVYVEVTTYVEVEQPYKMRYTSPFYVPELLRYFAPKSAKIPKIVTGLTLPTPKRPKRGRFCIRRREILRRDRTALQNALNCTFLRSSFTEIRCCKVLGENIFGLYSKCIGTSNSTGTFS